MALPPQFDYVQFSYRFDLILGCVLPVAVLLGVRSRRGRGWVVALWVAFYAVPFATRIAQQHAREGWVTASQLALQVPGGHAGSGEFGTAGVERRQVDVGEDRIVAVGGAGVGRAGGSPGAACGAAETLWDPERREFESLSAGGVAGSCAYRVALAYYPDWHVWIDGVEAGMLAPDANGLTRVMVPFGRHAVSLRFVRPRLAGLVSGVISGSGLLLLGGVWRWSKRATAIGQPARTLAGVGGRSRGGRSRGGQLEEAAIRT